MRCSGRTQHNRSETAAEAPLCRFGNCPHSTPAQRLVRYYTGKSDEGRGIPVDDNASSPNLQKNKDIKKDITLSLYHDDMYWDTYVIVTL